MTPAELVAQWLPRLRRIAWKTGSEVEDIKQEAWLLAAGGVRNPESADFIPRWLSAVERRARALAGGRIISPPPRLRRQVELAGGLGGQADDPAAWVAAIEAVDKRLGGQDAQQVANQPVTALEIAKALGKSQRQARRIKRKLEAMEAVQGDFWGVLA